MKRARSLHLKPIHRPSFSKLSSKHVKSSTIMEILQHKALVSNKASDSEKSFSRQNPQKHLLQKHLQWE